VKRPSKQRLLIFVIAYYAEETLQSVLERIPRSIFDEYDCEILVVDDASEDRTFAIGREYKKKHPEIRMTILRNEYNQGYGGNQMVGYRYAATEGFDFVAMVHGDGQYAPEELPRLVAPLAAGEADAVFGSRMMTRLGALKGGMPLYKFVGNKILTTAQNMLLGSKLSEFHSGYRVYSVAALKKINYVLNSKDFHFDTEIIIQLLNAKQRILELAVPTFYGDEISRVAGMKYAREVMLATMRNALHRAGLMHVRRFEPVGSRYSRDDLKTGYPSSHSYALDAVPQGARVLDIGSGPNGLAQELVKKGCDVAVVDDHPPAHKDADVQVFVAAPEDTASYDASHYKYLLLLDVIEHMPDPEGFLSGLRAQFDHEKKTLILTTPNIGFVIPRLMLLLGQFNYGQAGILARTHTRLFTFRSTKHLLRDAGFQVKRVRGVPAPFPKALGQGPLASVALGLNEALIRVSKTLFAYQIYVEAESTPDIDFVLRDTKEQSAAREAKPVPVPNIRLASSGGRGKD
jgi:glycosyltransferase involved in cell wall biosynthesis